MINTKPQLSGNRNLRNSNTESCVRLFCFPYAGGSANIFRSWSHLPPFIDICPIELPGRGSRIAESLCTNLPMLLQDLVIPVLQRQDKPFAFFGHSLGALIAFELTRLLRRSFNLQPLCLFVSGYVAPGYSQKGVPKSKKTTPIHTLSNPQFIEKLRKFNGTPEEVLNDAKVMEIMMPILRADFSITETYTYTSESPLDCPIIAFGGLKDSEVNLSSIEAWRNHTTNNFSMRVFPGDHFFLRSDEQLLLQEISRELKTFVDA